MDDRQPTDRQPIGRPERSAAARLASRELSALLLIGALVAAACTGTGGGATSIPTAGSGGTPSPTDGVPGGSTAPTPRSSGAVPTAEEAAARVIASNPLFAATGIGPYNPDLVGQAAWWTAEPATDGFVVTIRIGWGDCQAGCIDEHTWVYGVTSDGTVTLRGESGDGYPPGGGDGGPADTDGISGRVTAGPVCPVEQAPPDPACADRPVDGAVIVVRDAAGIEVARVTTTTDGHFALDLPVGMYTLEPQPVEGLLGTATPVEVTVKPGGPPLQVEIAYDTGIR